jgi:hypothetical protein
MLVFACRCRWQGVVEGRRHFLVEVLLPNWVVITFIFAAEGETKEQELYVGKTDVVVMASNTEKCN